MAGILRVENSKLFGDKHLTILEAVKGSIHLLFTNYDILFL
jgi:hypothetical protein